MTEWVWITDRQPAKQDEDWNGEVCMMRFPGERTSSGGESVALVAAAHVGPGVPWMHTDDWIPPATPEPQPEAPQPASKPNLRVGQVWRSRCGKCVAIDREDGRSDHPYLGSNKERYTPGGRLRLLGEHPWDLVELITDTPAEAPQPQSEPAPTTRKVPRGFLAFLDMPRVPGVMGRRLIAIATDGTAWSREPDDRGGGWTQVEPLPDREEPINA